MFEKDNNIGIYIHIPFCIKKCPYCNFYSITTINYDIINKFVDKVCCNIVSWNNILLGTTADTIYFGGGTPNIIGTNNLVKIIKTIQKYFGDNQREISIEINPEMYENLDFSILKESGLNRVSIGAQSLDVNDLVCLGRRHTPYDIEKCIYKLKISGIDNISLDVMMGVPNQNFDSLRNSIEFCLTHKIRHISLYMLKIEQGTYYHHIADKLNLQDEEELSDNYLLISNTLRHFGYKHYEISNFCMDGFECLHNMKYWNLDEYLGVGPSAHSFVNGVRFYYKNDLIDFLNESNISYEMSKSHEQDYIMLRLRLAEGLKYDLFKEKFGYEFPDKYLLNTKHYENTKFLISDDKGIRLTPEGFLVSNNIISKIIF